MAPTTSSLRYPLLVLASGGFVSGMSIRLAEPLLPRVASDFGSSVADASILITAFALAYGLFQLVHGPLGDRIGRLRAVCGALCLAALASAACASAESLASLALYRFLTGMTAGAVIPLSFAFVGDNVPYQERQAVLGRFISGTLLGATFGPLIGGSFSDALGWRASFLAPALAFALIGALLLPLARREARPGAPAPGAGPVASYLALLRSPSARTICLAVGLEGILFYGAFGYLGAFLRHEFEVSYTLIGVVLAGFGIGGLLYSLSVRALVRWLGQARMVAWGGALLLAGFTLTAVSASWQLAAPLVLVLGFGFYLVHNSLQTLATEMAPTARGAAISLFAFALFFGQALGVTLDGQIVTWLGYRAMLAMTGLGLLLLAMWLSAAIKRL